MGLLGKLPKESRPQLAGTLSCPSGFSPSSSLQCRSDDQSSGSHPGTRDDLKEGKACARMQGWNLRCLWLWWHWSYDASPRLRTSRHLLNKEGKKKKLPKLFDFLGYRRQSMRNRPSVHPAMFAFVVHLMNNPNKVKCNDLGGTAFSFPSWHTLPPLARNLFPSASLFFWQRAEKIKNC